MRPKRILFVIRSYRPDQVGGGAKSVQTLAEGLAGRGHDVHVLRLAPKGAEGDYYCRAVETGVAGAGKPELHILPIRNIFWPYEKAEHSRAAKAVWHLIDLHNPMAARDLRKLLKDIQPDIVNTSIIDGFSPSIFREVGRSGAKLIHTLRDYYLICSRSSMYRGARNCESLCVSCRLVRTINRRRIQYVDLFLSNSAFVAETHRRFDGLPRTTPCRVQWNINEQSLASEPRSLNRDSLVFGYIGRLAPTKGVEMLIEAAANLPSAGRAWTLLIAGDGPEAYTANLREKARNMPNVKFIGWVDADSFYEQVDVLVCPSVYNEPLPRVIYEAYGFALPVIASRVGGHPEIVDEGRSGELYDGNDVMRLSGHLQLFREMTAHRYGQYSENALRMGRRFSPDVVIDEFERRMSEVLAERS